MNHRLASIVEGVKTVACCCVLKEVKWKVGYLKKEPAELPGMFKSKWTEVEVMAYTRLDAANKVGKQVGVKFRPGYNCFVTKVIGG